VAFAGASTAIAKPLAAPTQTEAPGATWSFVTIDVDEPNEQLEKHLALTPGAIVRFVRKRHTEHSSHVSISLDAVATGGTPLLQRSTANVPTLIGTRTVTAFVAKRQGASALSIVRSGSADRKIPFTVYAP